MTGNREWLRESVAVSEAIGPVTVGAGTAPSALPATIDSSAAATKPCGCCNNLPRTCFVNCFFDMVSLPLVVVPCRSRLLALAIGVSRLFEVHWSWRLPAFPFDATPILSLRIVGQSHLDALVWILSEFEGFDAPGEIEEVCLNRGKIELGAGQEPQSRRPNAGRTDRALDGQRLALNLADLD